MANLTDLITDEQFEAGEKNRLAVLRHYCQVQCKYQEKSQTEIEGSQKRLASYRLTLEDTPSMIVMANLACLRLYLQETEQLDQLRELEEQTNHLSKFRKTYFGEIALLYHEPRKITRQEFFQALQNDLKFIEGFYEASKDFMVQMDPELRLAAARRVGGILEYFNRCFRNRELTEQVLGKYQDLLLYWLENP